MQAFLLCAGQGTRLRPLTYILPKVMMPVSGRPLLEVWLTVLEASGVTKVFINTHHMAHVIEDYLCRVKFPNLEIELIHEEVLLGTAGTISANRKKFSSDLLVIHADNFGMFDLKPFLKFHAGNLKFDYSIMTFKTPNPNECGIFEKDSRGMIVGFEEKPRCAKSNIANSAIYVFKPQILDFIQENKLCDLSTDLVSLHYNRAALWAYEGVFFDIGNSESLVKANNQMIDIQLPEQIEWHQEYREKFIVEINNLMGSKDHG
jgi:mannose-1-phosphate guanylyltransferase